MPLKFEEVETCIVSLLPGEYPKHSEYQLGFKGQYFPLLLSKLGKKEIHIVGARNREQKEQPNLASHMHTHMHL